jgi:hypothetical protein
MVSMLDAETSCRIDQYQCKKSEWIMKNSTNKVKF